MMQVEVHYRISALPRKERDNQSFLSSLCEDIMRRKPPENQEQDLYEELDHDGIVTSNFWPPGL